MAKTFAGVIAVSIAALLFAGCSGGSKPVQTTTQSTLSPLQTERCAELRQRIDDGLLRFSREQRATDYFSIMGTPLGQAIDDAKKERAALGC